MSAALLAAIPLVVFELAADDGGFVATGDSAQWEWGRTETALLGPGRAWGTRLADPYRHNGSDFLEVPLPARGEAERPVLVVKHWYSVVEGDTAYFEVDDGVGWHKVDPAFGYPTASGFVGSVATWEQATIDLSPFGPTARFRLAFLTDASDASEGWFVGRVTLWDGDPTPPFLTVLEAPVDTQDMDGPYTVAIQAIDDVGVEAVSLSWSVDGGSPQREAMVPVEDHWLGSIPGQPPGSQLSWHVEAEDTENVTRLPATEDFDFRVFLAAPRGLARDDDARVGMAVEVSWLEPDTPHPVSQYEVWQVDSDAPAASTRRLHAEVPLDPDLPAVVWTRAVYMDALGPGDSSEELALDVSVPQLLSIEPSQLHQGDAMRLAVDVSSAYLVEGGAASLGDGVTVVDVEVRDVATVSIEVQVDSAAETGWRDLTLSGVHGVHTFREAIEIRPEAEGLRTLVVSPRTIVQGQDERILVTAPVLFASDVSIDPGEDLHVVSAPVTVRDVVEVTLAASTVARLGEHTLVLDDGQRLWTAVLDVEEYVAPPETRCSTGGVRGGWWGCLVLVGVCRRRRRVSAERGPSPPEPSWRAGVRQA